MLAKKSPEGPRTHKNEQVSCLIPWGQDRSACWELLFMNTWGHSKKIGKKWLSELSVWLLFALVSSQFYSFPSQLLFKIHFSLVGESKVSSTKYFSEKSIDIICFQRRKKKQWCSPSMIGERSSKGKVR